MKLLFCRGVCFLAWVPLCLGLPAPTASALRFLPTDATDIVADGHVVTDEWDDADWESDDPGYGTMYAMYRNGYDVGNGSYTGTFQFLLHDIKMLTSNDDWD